MNSDNIQDQLERIYFFCQMFNYGFGRSGLWTINDPIAYGYNTFANIHLLSTMFLVDKRDKPIGGFVYPILASIKKEGFLDNVQSVFTKEVKGTSFEEYLRKYRNKLATHGDLSPHSLPDNIREIILGEDTDERLLDLLDELREAVENLTTKIQSELNIAGI